MNSALQILVRLPGVKEYFLSGAWVSDADRNRNDPNSEMLADYLATFF